MEQNKSYPQREEEKEIDDWLKDLPVTEKEIEDAEFIPALIGD